jgi:hypothetical protein
MIELIEIEPGRFRVARPVYQPARSALPCPHVISDTMDAVEQVDGRYYTSKRQYRAVGRSLGLTEVGNEKPKPKVRETDTPRVKQERQAALKTAMERYAAGHRPRS